MTNEALDLKRRASRIIGIDLDWEGLVKNDIITDKVFGKLEGLPFTQEVFDLITANMVIEHLETPEAVLREAYRVLKPGGLFVLHTPNRRAVSMRIASMLPEKVKVPLIWLLEGRRAQDVFPTVYRMNTPAEIVAIAQMEGFQVIDLKKVSSNALTHMLAPLALVELVYLRILELKRFEDWRSNLIAVARKPAVARSTFAVKADHTQA
jgi:ubiquinone/menaquinone biosynthesis C-methylase UbiE